MEEFKRLGDKLSNETANLYRRIEILEKTGLDGAGGEGLSKQLLDEKLDKQEFSNFVSLLTEDTISPM